jgi:hypothetical protein
MNDVYPGRERVVIFDGVDLSPYMRTFDASPNQNLLDSTAGNIRGMRHVKGHTSADFSSQLLVPFSESGTAGDDVLSVLVEGHEGTLEIGPQGSAEGSPKYSCVATITSPNGSWPHDGMAVFNVSWQRNGDWIAHYGEDPVTGVWS